MFWNLLAAALCFGAARYFWHMTTPYFSVAMVVFGTINLMAFAVGVVS